MDKRKERELAKRQKEVERASRQTMQLKLREVGPPDDLDIEMADLQRAAGPPASESGDGEQREEPLERPPWPPADLLARVVPAFRGALCCRSHLRRCSWYWRVGACS